MQNPSVGQLEQMLAAEGRLAERLAAAENDAAALLDVARTDAAAIVADAERRVAAAIADLDRQLDQERRARLGALNAESRRRVARFASIDATSGRNLVATLLDRVVATEPVASASTDPPPPPLTERSRP